MTDDEQQPLLEGQVPVTAESRAQDPYDRPGYEPVLEREGLERRVLGTITDEEDGFATLAPGTVPRNSIDALMLSLARDENVPQIDPADLVQANRDVEAIVGELVEAGLVEQRDDGTYGLTEAGFVELHN